MDPNVIRFVMSITHLVLAALGTVNLIVILLILVRPSMRTVTNVYMVGLCLADFIYVTDLSLVAITQLNNKVWIFGQFVCRLYYGTEATSKYATVLFVVLMALDRYCAVCRPCWRKFRVFHVALGASFLAWGIAIIASTPLYLFAFVGPSTFPPQGNATFSLNITSKEDVNCLVSWGKHGVSRTVARCYICLTAITVFFLPLLFIFFFNYHILKKMREAMKTNRRMSRSASSRAPYQRVTYLVLTVIFVHIISWTPLWVYTLYSTLFRPPSPSLTSKLFLNFMHLLPYINCAVNPFIYLANFRKVVRSVLQQIFLCSYWRNNVSTERAGKSCGFRPTTTRSHCDSEMSEAYSSHVRFAKHKKDNSMLSPNAVHDKTASTMLTNDLPLSDAVRTNGRHSPSFGRCLNVVTVPGNNEEKKLIDSAQNVDDE